MYSLLIGDKSGDLELTLAYFSGEQFSTTYLEQLLSERNKIWQC